MKTIDSFLEDRFGMFIHFGLYAIPARGEWYRSHERISIDDYQTYFDSFNPINYNPYEWASLAKEAGMKYIVLTAKHHDGFCLFDSKYTSYKSTNTPYGKDIIKEYVMACRQVGIKVGIYYSLIDWYHEDYPTFHDLFHPMRDNIEYKDKVSMQDFSRYVEYMHNQIRELMSNYGVIDILWFDFSYNNPDDCVVKTLKHEAWKAYELCQMVRELQPGILINNRLGGTLGQGDDQTYSGDFSSPEQIIPARGMRDLNNNLIPWEACVTMNSSWGYKTNATDYKSCQVIIRALVECVSKGGNLLLNVGPNALGSFSKNDIKLLKEIGQWMNLNSDSIYGATNCVYEKPEWGRFTQKGHKIYAHVYDRGVGPITLLNMANKVKKASYLATGAQVSLERPFNVSKFKLDSFIMIEQSGLPDEIDTVIELEMMEDNDE